MDGNTSKADEALGEPVRRLLGAIHEPCLVIEPGGRIVAANEAAARAFGVPITRLAGDALDALCESLSEPLESFLRRCVGSGERCLGSLAIPAAGGAQAMRVEGSRYVPQAGAAPLVLVRMRPRDVAASQFLTLNRRLDQLQQEVQRRRVAEEHLAQKLDELAETDRQKSRFLALLSHELRNPLAPIRNMLHVLRLDPRRESLERNVAVMERHVNHLVRLVDDLLDLSRISTGKVRVSLGPVALDEVVGLAAGGARARAEAKGQELRVAAPGDVVVVADADRLRQVLGNLLDNAIKFTPRGGHIALTARVEAGRAHVHVEDDGPGIPPALLGRIFTFFAQDEDLLYRGDAGLGIGLALAKNLVELQGGTLEYRPSARGAHFVVSIPLAPAPAATPARRSPQPQHDD